MISPVGTLPFLILALVSRKTEADLERVGPVNTPSPPGHGFPFWYQDQSGLVLDLCLPDATDPGDLQRTACLLGPEPPNPPFSFPNNFPDEAFYFRAVSGPLNFPNGPRAVLVLALEAAFASGTAAPGQQVVFTRIRVTAGVLEDGTYTVTHPYGTETFPNIVASGTNRDIVFTEDVGISPGIFTEALTSRVGPFLQASTVAGGAPLAPQAVNGAQFLSDGATLTPITGSPFSTNYFEICGVRPDGTDIPCLRTDLFTLTGRVRNLATQPIGSPLKVQLATYARDDVGTQVDVWVRAKAGIGQNPPKISLAGRNVQSILMDGPNAVGEYYGQGVTDQAGSIPGTITVINSGDVPPSSVTVDAVDRVTILQAQYDTNTDTLTVMATSSDKGFQIAPPPTLTLEGFPAATRSGGFADPAQARFVISGVFVAPSIVTVLSQVGGRDNAVVETTRGIPFPAGVPLAVDDFATAVQRGASVSIPVLANDNGATGVVSIVAPFATLGTATVDATTKNIIYQPGPNVGTDKIRYAVSNAVGSSNAGIVMVEVTADLLGPVPTAVNDGPIMVFPNVPKLIDVLANDNANGGALNRATVSIATPPARGTATAAADGTITFTATPALGSITFTYTVSNTANPTTSNQATVTVQVADPESLLITRAQCRRVGASGDWTVRGTSSVSSGNSITVKNSTGATVGTVPVTLGAWALAARGGPPCTATATVQSTLGTIRSTPVTTR